MMMWRFAVHFSIAIALVCILVHLRMCASDFDVVQSPRVGIKSQHYGNMNRLRRSSSTTDYSPLRIRVFYHELDTELNDTQQQWLEKAVKGATGRISQLLSVVPVIDRILLSRRTACAGQWNDGPAAGKCAILSSNYQGEIVQDGFILPEEHLDGLEVCPQPTLDSCRVVYEAGNGTSNADLVVYIQAISTERCKNPNLVAYAGHFELDQNRRPIAGYANYCPRYLKSSIFEEAVLEMVAIHEFFHVLAYNEQLFKEFRNCSGSGKCRPYENTTIVKDDAFHLVTPTITEHVRVHLNCKEAVGAVLENYGSSSTGSSHLEMRVFRGSVMTAAINRPDLTFIDKSTLAVFEDTGWYKVSYETADFNPWGVDQGCDFGHTSNCQADSGVYFCSPGSPQGCHFMLRDKAVCSTSVYLDNCYVQEPVSNGNCLTNTDTSYGQTVGPESACFQGTIISGNTAVFQSGFCLAFNCSHSPGVSVKVGPSQYQRCNSGSTTTFPGQLLQDVSCPTEPSVLCPPLVSSKVVPTTVKSSLQTVVEGGTSNYPTHSTDSMLTAQMMPTSVLSAINHYSIRSSFADKLFSSSDSQTAESTLPAVTTRYVDDFPSSVVTRKTPSNPQMFSSISIRTHGKSIKSSVLTSSPVLPRGLFLTSSAALLHQHFSKHSNQIQPSSYKERVSVTATTYKTSTHDSISGSSSTSQSHSTAQNFYVEIIFPLNFDEVANDMANFIEAIVNYLVATLAVDRTRITKLQVSAGSIVVSFTIVSQTNVTSTAISSKEVGSMIQSSVLAGRLTFTFNGINFTASNASYRLETDDSPTVSLAHRSSTESDSSTSAIVPSALVGILTAVVAICGLMYYLKQKKTEVKVAPHDLYQRPTTAFVKIRQELV